MASVAIELFPLGEIDPDNDQPPIWTHIMESLDDFGYQYSDIKEVSVRAPSALALVDELRKDFRRETSKNSSYTWQLKSKTQLDAIEWLAWNDLWYYGRDSNTVEIPGQDKPRTIRQEEFEATAQLFNDIESYHVSFAQDPELAYEELLDSFYRARLVVKNPSGLPAIEKNVDHVALIQELAIYQTINALRLGGFPKTRRPTLQEKEKKIDAIVPVGKYSQSDVAIRLQAGCQQSGRLEATATRGLLFVNLPYNSVKAHPFAMSYEDKAALSSGVMEMWTGSLALKLGAEVLNAA